VSTSVPSGTEGAGHVWGRCWTTFKLDVPKERAEVHGFGVGLWPEKLWVSAQSSRAGVPILTPLEADAMSATPPCTGVRVHVLRQSQQQCS